MVGRTERNRWAARSTWRDARWRSRGAVARQARSTTAGASTRATADANAGRPVAAPAETIPASKAAQVAASVRRRRVRPSGELRPRTGRPRGPNASPADPRATSGTHHDTPAQAAPRTKSGTLARTPTHHRLAKRTAAPGR